MKYYIFFRYAMACSGDADIIKTYIDRTIDSSLVRKQDQRETLSYIGDHESNKYLVFDYVADNYEKITTAYVNYLLL